MTRWERLLEAAPLLRRGLRRLLALYVKNKNFLSSHHCPQMSMALLKITKKHKARSLILMTSESGLRHRIGIYIHIYIYAYINYREVVYKTTIHAFLYLVLRGTRGHSPQAVGVWRWEDVCKTKSSLSRWPWVTRLISHGDRQLKAWGSGHRLVGLDFRFRG